MRVYFLSILVLTLSTWAVADPQSWYQQIDQTSPQAKDSLDKNERQSLLEAVRNHRVASLAQLGKYDPDGLIGFCFGRAMAAHLMARQRGLKGGAIKKLFIIGDLRSGPNPEWRFHVTTLVRGDAEGHWYTLDPIMGNSMKVEDWIDTVRGTWDKAKTAHLYFADTSAILPDERIFPLLKENETGTRIIDSTFDPIGKAGFVETAFAATKVYAVDQAAEWQHFLTIDNPSVDDRFSFLLLKALILKGPERKEHVFDFRNYFTDLLDDLLHPQLEEVAFPEVDPGDLYSLRVF